MAEWESGPLPAGWSEFDDDNEIWKKFHRRLNFSPSTKKANWPGIDQRPPAKTFALPHNSSIDLQHTWDVFLKCLKDLVRPGQEEIYVLDWQHQSYRLRPRAAGPDWVIHPIPDGDYHIFLQPDFRYFTFGHPWEWTLTAHGQLLIDRLASHQIPCLTNIARTC